MNIWTRNVNLDTSNQTTMSYVCSISGEQCEVPVVSPRSGAIFEKRLLLRFIEENDCDPLTREKLHVSELVELKVDPATQASHRTINTASLPALMKTLQDEWDFCE